VRTDLNARLKRPRRLLAIFAIVTLVPAIGLVWLGTTLIGQDRELAEKQLRDRLEREADTVAADTAKDLARPPTDAFTDDVAPGVRSVDRAMWTAAEAEEDRGRYDQAIAAYQRIVASRDPAIRAEALLRLARTLRKAGRSDAALDVYLQLQSMDDVRVFEGPASLWAALGRVTELDRCGRSTDRDREAAAIRSDLVRGRWRLGAADFDNAWAQVASAKVLAAAWQRRWLERGLAVVLADSEGTAIVQSGRLSGPTVVRSPADSGVPWTIRVSSVSPDAELAAFAARRRQLVLVLSLAAFLVFAGAYFVARGMRRELAAADLQSTFVSGVSHEFRTPLTSMSHLIELLRDRTDMDEARRARYYDALEQEASRLRRCVDQLLAFGRVDAGEVRYEFRSADPCGFVETVVGRFRSGPAAGGHAVTVSRPAAAPGVTIDSETLALALNNLLENAAKYSPRDAAIEVTVRYDDQTARVQIGVTDHGPGIPLDEQRLVFEKFVRGRNAHDSGVRGTGIGLTLARELVRAHGGDVTITSQVGRGSTFTIAIPSASASP
jgi:signal transduction histidine kinase